MTKYYDPQKMILKNIGLTIGTGVGLGVTGKIASGVDTATGTTTASSIFSSTAPIMAQVPLVSASSSLLGSLSMLNVNTKRKLKY